MAYVVNNTRGQIIAIIPDGTSNVTATSQTLIGKNVTPYGELEVENLVHQLENFADSNPPGNPIEGQFWYDTGNNIVNVYTVGTGGNSWATVSGMTVSTTEPMINPKVGDLWYNPTTYNTQIYSSIPTGFDWISLDTVTVANATPTGTIPGELYFNSNTNQLFVYDGAAWDLIGPEGVPNFATTRWQSTTLPDAGNVMHPVMLGTVDGDVVSIVSTDTFTINVGYAPTGFTSLVSGINMASGSVLNGVATSANQLATARAINGVAFDGTANITIGNPGYLNAGSYLTGGPYIGTTNVTIAVNATSSNTANTVVARSVSGGFSAGTITANLVGTVTGNATNVSGVVAANHGGTGFSNYSDGDILIGNVATSSLDRGTLTGAGPITVTYTGNSLQIGYAGGTGTGNVTSVGITAGTGIGVSDSPITSAGNITVTNTGVIRFNSGTGISSTGINGNITVTNTGVTSLTAGGGIGLSAGTGGVTVTNTGVTRIIPGANISISPGSGTGEVIISSSGGSGGGGGGAGTVVQVATGAGLTGGPITSSGTIAVDASVMRSNVAQTITAIKTYTGGIVSQAYDFTSVSNRIFYNALPTALQVTVNGQTGQYFYPNRFVVVGNADGVAGELYRGGSVVGADGSTNGGAGVIGWHTNNIAGLGIGTGAIASSVSFTGAVFQGVASRPKSDAFIQIRSYSNSSDPVFQVTGGGNVTADGTYTSPAADYAEYFEWADSNPDNQDRVGMSVTLTGNQIRIAEPGDDVIGIVSATPAVIGDAAEFGWNQKYLKDEFGRELREEYHEWEWTNKDGDIHTVASYNDVSHVPTNAVKKTHDGLGNLLTRPVLNPAYDPASKYTPRSQRKEWAPVGLVGKLRMRVGQVTAPGWIKLRDISQNVEEWLVK